MIRINTTNELGHGQVAELVGRIRWVNGRVFIDVGGLTDDVTGAGVPLDEHLAGRPIQWVPLAVVETTAAARDRILPIVTGRAAGDEPPPFLLDWLDVVHVDLVEQEAVDVVEMWSQARAAVGGAGR